jgi:hypothetical protein
MNLAFLRQSRDHANRDAPSDFHFGKTTRALERRRWHPQPGSKRCIQRGDEPLGGPRGPQARSPGIPGDARGDPGDYLGDQTGYRRGSAGDSWRKSFRFGDSTVERSMRMKSGVAPKRKSAEGGRNNVR